MGTKDISTLIPDIQNLFEGHIFDPQNLKKFTSVIEHVIETQFREYGEERKPYLRMSNIGKPLRQLWFEVKSGLSPEKLSTETKFKFMYGHLLEAVVIALAIEAGHSVTDMQRKVEVNNVSGSIDCIIDDYLVDAKSCSTYSFAKFRTGSIRQDDPFGYIGQLSGYVSGLRMDSNPPTLQGAAFLAIDKVVGNLHLFKLEQEEINKYDIRRRITEARRVLERTDPPLEFCYEPIPENKSGNLKLPIGCSYCNHKFNCHPTVRTFLYASGPVYLTKVVRTPAVFEVLNNKKDQ